MPPDEARKYLAYFRIGLGAMWFTPRLGAKIFGLDPHNNDGVALLARLFAVRDLALGLGLLQSRGADADRLIDLGIMVDAADVAALVLAAGKKDVGARTLLLGGGAAGLALALGLMGRASDA
ncbi:MAG: hypothetical protein ACR2HR_00240 [Euzebya sp.]